MNKKMKIAFQKSIIFVVYIVSSKSNAMEGWTLYDDVEMQRCGKYSVLINESKPMPDLVPWGEQEGYGKDPYPLQGQDIESQICVDYSQKKKSPQFSYEFFKPECMPKELVGSTFEYLDVHAF